MTFKRPIGAGWAVLGCCAVGFVPPALVDTAAPAAAADAPRRRRGPGRPTRAIRPGCSYPRALVLMMSIPGLALFYGGLVRTKNMLSVLTQVFVIVAMVGVIWTLYGYSLAFSDGGSLTAYIGGFGKALLAGVDATSTAATFSNGVVIPEIAYMVFQMTFAMITPALIVGAFAERIKFSAVMLFILLWVTFIYFPIAHWVWYVAAPDDVAAAAKALAAATDAAAKAAAQAKLDDVTGAVGWLAGAGALDFAGGTVVHINAGIAGLVGAPDHRQADRLSQGPDGAAFADHDHDRRLAAVGRLVRLQRRIEPRGQRHHRARLRQHHGGDRGRGAVLAVDGMDGQGQALAARHLLRRGRRPGGGHAGSGLPVRSARWCWASWSRRSACSSSAR